MPIRFQVDADFYDHPKSIGLSDAATALWVRAGSYSAAKLLDGFIAEHVISTLSQAPEDASAELVARGLWRRTRGGFRFHQWDQRNLTRARVEADREADRKRKRKGRETAGQNGSEQVNGNIVRPESMPDSDRSPPGFQPLSVSVSVSESVSGSGHEPPPVGDGPVSAPPDRCSDHLGDPDPPWCGRCAATRRALEAWQRAQLRLDAERRSAEAKAQAAAVKTAIGRCRDCDADGYLPGGKVCPHDPTAADRSQRGAAAVRAALSRPPAA